MTSAEQSKVFKIAGFVFLAVGVIGVALDYWAAGRAPESSDPDMLTYDQAVSRAQNFQAGQNYGTIGQVFVGLTNSLKNPDARAVLILVVCGVVATAFFFIARRLKENESG